jgi:hypothetical protein
MPPFVPLSFVVPERLEQPRFTLRQLRISDAVNDYAAVMSSLDTLHGVFGPTHDWPTEALTFEQDLIDLGWHHKEFQNRTSFAYTVISPDESTCLGCAYLYPSDRPEYDAVAYCWVRKSALPDGLDPLLFNTFKRWLAESWPFNSVAFPGREIPWSRWHRG